MNIKDFLFYFMIIIIVGLSIYLIYFVKTESYKCISAPFQYGIKNLKSSNDQPVTCSCSFAGSLNSLIITKDNITKSDNILYKKINWKDL